MSEIQYNLDERFEFTTTTRKHLVALLVTGVIVTIIGVILAMNSGHGDGGEGHALNASSQNFIASVEVNALAADEGEGSHGTPTWLKRLYVSLWQNNVFFAGLGLIGVVFLAIQYASQAGWSAGFKRVPEAMGYWLPFAGIVMVILFFVAGHDIFHWTHTGPDVDIYDENGGHFDQIINGKKAFFFWPAAEDPGFPVFWFGRLILFFTIWYWMFTRLRKLSLQEDEIGGHKPFLQMRSLSAIFLVVFAVTSSIAAWDWVMSIDTHWFSTMFGWYVFASWWVAGLAMITFLVIWLKDKGLLEIVNHNHLHDLGKFVFAFSIFWTYIWFSQFLLIFYANIPEESIYFVERVTTQYKGFFYANIFLNFIFPFLFLMTRDSKRHRVFLKIVCVIVIFGHWLDFFLMVTPGTMQYDGGFGFVEIGVTMVFLSLFLYVVLSNLAKVPLVAKNHPMLEESLHHHI